MVKSDADATGPQGPSRPLLQPQMACMLSKTTTCRGLMRPLAPWHNVNLFSAPTLFSSE